MDHDYNFNTFKEIEVTKDFLSLSLETAKYQNIESYDNCATREYIDTLLKECKCIPFNMILEENEVGNFKTSVIKFLKQIFSQENICTADQLSCIKNITVDYSQCYKRCDGMYITSYDKSEMDASLQLLVSKLSAEYNDYKKAYKFPTKYKGKFFSGSVDNLFFSSF